MWSRRITSQRVKKNRELIAFGYVRNSTEINSIPLDIIKLIFKFSDNGVRWIINDIQTDNNHNLQKFLRCKLQDTMYGPKFEPISGMICQLTLSPNGWNVADSGFVMCYFEVHKLPILIKSITLSFVLYFKEFDYEYIKTVCYHQKGTNKCHGWSNSIKLKFIKIKQLKSLQIECITDIIHVEYIKSLQSKNVINFIPYIQDETEFIWDISEDLLNAFRNTHNYKLYYSDTVYDNCWMLRCAPLGINTRFHGNLWLFLQLIRVPFRMESVNVCYEINACYSLNKTYLTKINQCENINKIYTTKENGQNWFSVDMDGADGWGRNMFSSSFLRKIDTLAFKIRIVKRQVKIYQH